MDNLQERLSKLGNPTTSDYIEKLRKIIFDDSVQYSDEDYIRIISDGHTDYLRFAAFYCLFTKYRRFEKTYSLIRLVESHIEEFKTNKELQYFYNIINSQYYKFKCLVSSNLEDSMTAIKYANAAIDNYFQKLSHDMGCFNNYADIVLDLAPIVGSDSFNVAMAIQYVDNAISIRERERGLSPYANYYCSKARLLILAKDFVKAKEMINLAISYERTDQKDSLIRISNYHNIELEIKTKEMLNELDYKIADASKRYSEIKKQMESQQSRYIEILSFFSATIALIIGAISITLSSNSFSESGALILVFTGSLIIGYAIFKILFSDNTAVIKMIISFLLSAGLIALGIIMGRGVF